MNIDHKLEAKMSEQEPVAWALYPPLDEMPKEPVMIFKCLKDANDEAIESGCDIVPLYRSPQPVLNDEEREALEYGIRQADEYDRVGLEDAKHAAIVFRGLLERAKK